MPHPINTTVTLAAADDDGIALSQSPGAAGLLTINGAFATGGVATMDAARRVIITSGGNDSSKTFTITGTGGAWRGDTVLTEVVTGTNGGIAASLQDFLTVTSIRISAASAGTVKVGTNTTGSGPWVVWSEYPADFQVGYSGWVLSGSPTWNIDYTLDDPFGTWLPSNITFPRAVIYAPTWGLTSSQNGSFAGTVMRASRLTLTAIGSVQLTQMQQGA